MKCAALKLLMLLLLLLFAFGSGTRQWLVLGHWRCPKPRLSAQSRSRVFLGTGTGVIFVSDDGGRGSLPRFAKLGAGDDYVLDHMALDPQNSKNIFVSLEPVQDQNAGDIFRNGGKDCSCRRCMGRWCARHGRILFPRQ